MFFGNVPKRQKLIVFIVIPVDMMAVDMTSFFRHNWLK
jgi:hypothetical protein